LTIFGEKIGVFLKKTNVMIKISHILALFGVKNATFFAEIFGENIFKIITSVPVWSPCRGTVSLSDFLKITPEED
jgi:hypothetical protein